MLREEAKQYLSEAFSEIDTYQKLVKLYPVLKQPTLYLKDTGIPSRVISHWKNNDLLIENSEASAGWNTFSFLEYIWLKAVEKMRKFGVPLKTIKKVKKVIIERIDVKWNSDTLNEIIDYGIKAIEKMSMSKEDKNNLIQLISNPELKQSVTKEDIIPSLLDSLIISTLLKNEEVGIIVFDNGDAVGWLDEFHTKIWGVEKLFRKSHLYISITSFVAEFLSDATKEKFLPYYLLVSEDELEVLRRIREKDLQEVVIKFPKGSGKENIDIITKKNVGLSKEQQDEVSRILSLKNYQSITIKNQGDGKLYVEKFHRKKL